MSIPLMSISQGRRQDFGSGGGGTSDKISYVEFLSSPLQQWPRKISVLGGHSARMYSSKTFEKNSKNL